MCLIVFAWRPDAAQPLLLAANRDEFHARPSAPMAFWDDAPLVLAGRDLEAGGTWLGVTRSGRFAAVTNIRDPQAGDHPAPRSRGDLTREFLAGTMAPPEYLREVHARRGDYLGFNLLLGDRDSLWYLHGERDAVAEPRLLEPGIYGLSNAALDVPWPKVRRAKAQLAELLAAPGQPPGTGALRACLADRTTAPAAELTLHGLEGEMAQRLSAQFIVTAQYGTRCCTTLQRHASGAQQVTEQRFEAAGTLIGEVEYALPAAG